MPTVPAVTITLVQNGNTLTLTSPPSGYTIIGERWQVIGETAAGAVVVYDKAVSTHEVVLPLIITEAQKTALDTFFHTTCKGAVETFTFTDHYGVAHAGARFTQPRLDYTKRADGRYAVVLAMRLAESAK